MIADNVNTLLTEFRAMALLPPGDDDTSLRRAREICSLVQARHQGGRTVAQAADKAYRTLEILLSRRRWKQEVQSVEALRKQIKLACDQLRVAVDSEVARQRK